MKLAYFSPLSPLPSGISDYSEELLPHLARYAQVHIFIDDFQPTNPAIHERFPVYSYQEYERRLEEEDYDIAIYQMGNSPYHRYIYPILLRHPGITVLHEPVLHHLIAGMTLDRGDYIEYLREMAYSAGIDGIRRAREVALSGSHPPFFEYALSERVVDASLGVIVHSQYAQDKVLQSRPRARVGIVPMGIPRQASSNKEEARATLGLDPEDFLVASFGQVSPHKRLPTAIKAFARLRALHSASRYFIVGNVVPEVDVIALLKEAGIEDAATVTGFVDKDTLDLYMSAVDVCVNLRYPTAGETSAAILRAMAAGLPTIVSDVGAVSEIPDDCCVKVGVDDMEEDAVFRALVKLAEQPDIRRAVGESARSYTNRQHTMERSAYRYIAFIHQVLASPTIPVQHQLQQVGDLDALSLLAHEMSTLGVEKRDAGVIRSIGRSVAGLGADS
ncbi:MAG: glycosyl transferase group 1 [Dehalococcoidia bacterium]|nr:glycosyl transferase group 1 [Dehalococcoidia bacterium]